MKRSEAQKANYNIPRKIRELQCGDCFNNLRWIITYQEKLGNYNENMVCGVANVIITYQEKLGNYNVNGERGNSL